jgi:hypothetical protein
MLLTIPLKVEFLHCEYLDMQYHTHLMDSMARAWSRRFVRCRPSEKPSSTLRKRAQPCQTCRSLTK